MPDGKSFGDVWITINCIRRCLRFCAQRNQHFHPYCRKWFLFGFHHNLQRQFSLLSTDEMRLDSASYRQKEKNRRHSLRPLLVKPWFNFNLEIFRSTHETSGKSVCMKLMPLVLFAYNGNLFSPARKGGFARRRSLSNPTVAGIFPV